METSMEYFQVTYKFIILTVFKFVWQMWNVHSGTNRMDPDQIPKIFGDTQKWSEKSSS